MERGFMRRKGHQGSTRNRAPLSFLQKYLAIRSSLIMTLSLMLLAGCGPKTSFFSGLQKDQSNNRNQHESQHRDQVPVPMNAEGTKKSQADSTTSQPEDTPADHPVSIAGAFLTECVWLSPDAQSGMGGIAGCRIAKISDGKNVEDPITVHALQLKAGPLNDSRTPLPGEGQHQIRFSVPEAFYGQDVKVDMDLEISSQKVNFRDVILSGLPSAKTMGDSVAKENGGAPLAPVVTQRVQAFKLGDDGLNNFVRCRSIEDKAINNIQGGLNAEILFSLSIDTEIDIEFRRICDHGAGSALSLLLARMELMNVDLGTLVDSATLPPSATGDDVPDGTEPTAKMTRKVRVPKGKYKLTVFPSKTTDAVRLDDMLIEEINIAGPGLVQGSHIIR